MSIWLVQLPDGSVKKTGVDPTNIAALVAGNLTAKQIAKRITELPAADQVAHLAAIHAFNPDLFDAVGMEHHGPPDDNFPFWRVALDPRPDQEEMPPGSGRLVEIREEDREKRFGPAPTPVEWWNTRPDLATAPPEPATEHSTEVESPTDEERADRIREAVRQLNKLIEAAFTAGLRIDVDVGEDELEPVNRPGYTCPIVLVEEIARPL